MLNHLCNLYDATCEQKQEEFVQLDVSVNVSEKWPEALHRGLASLMHSIRDHVKMDTTDENDRTKSCS